jgi:hypothetical protein
MACVSRNTSCHAGLGLDLVLDAAHVSEEEDERSGESLNSLLR